MDEKNKPAQYAEYINSHILPFINYSKLQESYTTDMEYAKGVLNRLHEAMISVYGSDTLTYDVSYEGFVIIPGVVRGRDNGNLCLALLEIDISSSGEHWGTNFLCKYGVIEQGFDEKDANISSELAAEIRKFISAFIPYDYCYTATIPRDFHVDNMLMPKPFTDILGDFQNHKVVLQNENPHQYEGVTDVHISEQEFKDKMKELLPGASDNAITALISYANELDADNVHPKGAFLSESYVSFILTARQYGTDNASRVLSICEESCLNPWEIFGAAELMKAGVTQKVIIDESINGTFDLTQKQWDEVKDGLEALRRGDLQAPTTGESVRIITEPELTAE